MSTSETFFWGFCGSLAVEIVMASQLFYGAKLEVPFRYKMLTFYLSRLLLALVAGGLAVAYGIDKPLLAVNIGAATPLIVQAFTKQLYGTGVSNDDIPPEVSPEE